ncbi:MAG: hypothetical protein JNJ40_09375 [Bacteroidia bacterium]|nr:hypothetical protein [Bacteroidia bacterium]
MLNLFEKDSFEFIENEFGLYIRLTSDRINEQLKYAKDNNISGFNITVSKGYLAKDLSFLNFVDTEQIKNLALIFHNDELDISLIHNIKSLEKLSVNMEFNQEIDFLMFPNLKYCNIYWNKKIKNLEKSLKLEELFLSKYVGDDLSYFKNLKRLKKFGIDQSPIKSLIGLEHLINIEYLALGYLKNINSIEIISHLTLLRKLRLYNLPKVESINCLKKLRYLEELIVDTLKNLDVIEGYNELNLKVKTVVLSKFKPK